MITEISKDVELSLMNKVTYDEVMQIIESKVESNKVKSTMKDFIADNGDEDEYFQAQVKSWFGD